MPNEKKTDHLTDYERAVCYYTLPRVTAPLGFGFLVLYTFLLLEAIGVLLYGVARDAQAWTHFGLIAIAVIVPAGILAFLLRTFINQINTRRALAETVGVPDSSPEGLELPDPFKGHILLRYERTSTELAFTITDRNNNELYRVEVLPKNAGWRVLNAARDPLFEVRVRRRLSSFGLASGVPPRMEVYRDEHRIATLTRRFSFTSPFTEIQFEDADTPGITVHDRCFRQKGYLVGRAYYLRRAIYLDVDESIMSDGVLAFYVALSR